MDNYDEITVNCVLFATGRAPCTEGLELDKAGGRTRRHAGHHRDPPDHGRGTDPAGLNPVVDRGCGRFRRCESPGVGAVIAKGLVAAVAALVSTGLMAQAGPPPQTHGARIVNANVDSGPTRAPVPQSGEIVVRGSAERRSSWRRAEGDHVVVYSNGSAAELKRMTANLDSLYAMMAHIFGREGQPDDSVKLELTLVGGDEFMRHLGLRNERSEEGPFAIEFRDQRYYDPRESGAVAAVARSDQLISTEPGEGDQADNDSDQAYDDGDYSGSLDADGAFDQDPSGNGGAGAMDVPGGSVFSMRDRRPPPEVTRPWEALAYSAFAQHFVLTHYPGAYPRWYLDGIGALFSTFETMPDGRMVWGRSPPGFDRVISTFGPIRSGPELSNAHAAAGKADDYTPYHAWIMAHYFLIGDAPPARRAQFARYISDISRGKSPAEAAKVFGNPAELDKDLTRYAAGKTYAIRFRLPAPRDPVIDRLTVSEAALLKARLQLTARTEFPPPVPAGLSARESVRAMKARNDALVRRDMFLTDLRRAAAKAPQSRPTLLLLADAECRSGDASGCAATANAALALDPHDAAAMTLKGEAARLGGAPDARAEIAAANRADVEALGPLLEYFRSFTSVGQPVPDVGLLGMLKVVERVPSATVPRLELGRELLRQKRDRVLAFKTLLPVAAGPYDSPERAEAVALLKAAGLLSVD